MTGGRVQPAHFFTLADSTLPAHWLLLLLPAGAVGLLGDRRRWTLAVIFVAFVLLYALNPFFLPHYCVVVVPSMILLGLLGVNAIARAAGGRAGSAIRVGLIVAVGTTAFTSLWEVKWTLSSASTRPQVERLSGKRDGCARSRRDRSHYAKPPAIVLFGTPPDVWTNMLYNVDVAWPDDAPIIHARDLGERNVELINYYGEHQPERTIYQFDWGRGSLKRLGQAGELRERLKTSRLASTSQSPSR